MHTGTTRNSSETCATPTVPSSTGVLSRSMAYMNVRDIRIDVRARLLHDYQDEVGASEPESDKGSGAEDVASYLGRAKNVRCRWAGKPFSRGGSVQECLARLVCLATHAHLFSRNARVELSSDKRRRADDVREAFYSARSARFRGSPPLCPTELATVLPVFCTSARRTLGER